MKTLIAYFSASGEAKKTAEALAPILRGDLYEIAPVPAYTAADLNWRDRHSRSTLLMNDESARPAIKEDYPDLSGYDRLLIGFPIWWGVEPREVDTFLDAVKPACPIYVYATSGGSPIETAVKHLKATYPSLDIREGRLLNFGVNEATLKGWIE